MRNDSPAWLTGPSAPFSAPGLARRRHAPHKRLYARRTVMNRFGTSVVSFSAIGLAECALLRAPGAQRHGGSGATTRGCVAAWPCCYMALLTLLTLRSSHLLFCAGVYSNRYLSVTSATCRVSPCYRQISPCHAPACAETARLTGLSAWLCTPMARWRSASHIRSVPAGEGCQASA